MRTDSDVQHDVEAELRWAPEVNDTDISVKVHDGVVTLTGFVHTHLEKDRAESAAMRIAGVKGIANDIQVALRPADKLDDPEIARAAVSEIRSVLPLTPDNVRVLVDHGHVTLEGSVQWHFQRERVERAVRRLRGVTAVDDQIRILPQVKPQEVKQLIEDAFRRSAEVDAKAITVETSGSEVRLVGKVRNWSERYQAQQTAWSAPGVTNVKNDLSVSF